MASSKADQKNHQKVTVQKELLSGIYDMVSGEINSLLLSTANNSEIASLNLSDEMKIGN